MKTILTLLLVLFTVQLQAKSIKLNYEPKGQIIVFKYDSLLFYTDRNSLNYILNKYQSDTYGNNIKSIVKERFILSGTDSITISGDFIVFNDSIKANYQGWDITHTLILLTEMNRLKIINQEGSLVSKVKGNKKSYTQKNPKKIGPNRSVWIVYIDKKTKRELLCELQLIIQNHPTWN